MIAERAWETVLDQLEEEMDKTAFDTWARNTRVIDFNGDTFTIGVPNDPAREWLESRISSFATRPCLQSWIP